MWQDKGLYWAWRGDGWATSPPPTEKTIRYSELWRDGKPYMKLATEVIENGVARKVHQDELAWHIKHGATVV